MVPSTPPGKLSSSRHFRVRWILGLIAAASGLALAAFFDLAVTRTVASPGGLLGRLVARFGEWPGILTALAALALLLRAPPTPSWEARRPIAASLVALTLLHPLALTQLLKHLWGRARPDALGAGAARFTPFYLPAGIGRGDSFPSGHVAISAVVVVFPLEAQMVGRSPRVRVGVWVLGMGYPLLVMAGRVVAGRHFLTDTLFSLEAALLIAPLLIRFFYRFFSRRARDES